MSTTGKRARLSLPVVLASASSAVLLAVPVMGSTMAGFGAEIANTVNTAGSGYLELTETNSDGSVTCVSSVDGLADNEAECSTIDKYGAELDMAPGDVVSTTVTLENSGTIDANTFTLTPGACASESTSGAIGAGELCDHMYVTVSDSSGEVVARTALSAWSGVVNLTALAAGASETFTFDIELDSGAPTSVQGMTLAQILTWNLAA